MVRGMSAISHRHIEVFRAVMLAGGVSEAARQLHSSQPTISRELARLEFLLGYALFERQRGRLKATARALALFDEVQRSFEGLERVTHRARALARDEPGALQLLSLPALTHALLPAACARLGDQGAIDITPQEPPLLDDWLSAQRFDLGLTEQGQGAEGVSFERLLSLDEVCVLPAGHALLAKPLLHPEDFAGQAFVSLASNDPYRRLIDAVFEAHGVQRQLRLQTHSAVAVCAMVEQGLGLAIVNPLTALACAGSRLQWRRFSLSIPYEVWLARPLHRPSHPRVELLCNALRMEAAALQQRLQH
ncbi:LysR family transcriptional regulator [Pelomonas sp. V22]|nr:LysR family transcriptional regulator [Pelomonas sp. V22]